VEYIKEQGLEEYLYYNDLWAEVVSKRQKFIDTPLNADVLELIFLFSYNLPELKEMIKKAEVTGFSKADLELPEEKLLEKGIIYIRDVLLSEENLW
jgi:hypothetical protein